MSYYFLVSSLPMLSLDSSPAISREDFLSTCEQHMSAEDFAVLQQLLGEDNLERSPDDNSFVTAWQDREIELRNAVARERASNRGAYADEFIRDQAGASAQIRQGVTESLSKKNPHEMEMVLDRLRWAVIEELQGLDLFSSIAVFGYGLRLALAERWAGLDRDKGQGRVESIVDNVTGSIE